MALSIKHPEADRLARELAKHTGEGLTEAVINALRERLARERRRVRGRRLSEELRAIGERCMRPAGPRPPRGGRDSGKRRARAASLMVLGTSLVLAVLLNEPDAHRFRLAIEADPVPHRAAERSGS